MTTPRSPRSAQLTLSVQYAVSANGKPTRAQFRQWVRAALEHDAQVTLRIVGQVEGQKLNQSFRNKPDATNVLTFVMRETPYFEGDLALCAPVVAREARAQKKSLTAHYAHLTVHGILHLQGYDHKIDADAQLMEAREAQIMAKLGYADPYQPVVTDPSA